MPIFNQEAVIDGGLCYLPNSTTEVLYWNHKTNKVKEISREQWTPGILFMDSILPINNNQLWGVKSDTLIVQLTGSGNDTR